MREDADESAPQTGTLAVSADQVSANVSTVAAAPRLRRRSNRGTPGPSP